MRPGRLNLEMLNVHILLCRFSTKDEILVPLALLAFDDGTEGGLLTTYSDADCKHKPIENRGHTIELQLSLRVDELVLRTG